MTKEVRDIRLNMLFNLANMTTCQRERIALRIDADGTDKDEFVRLSSIDKNIEEFVKRGKNLYIHSRQCGNGKSSWALRMAIDYINCIVEKTSLICKALYLNVPDYLMELKSNINEKSEFVYYVRKNIDKANLVIFDDIGTKSATQFEADALQTIIDRRLANKKSNIYTSNLSDDELHSVLGDRLASRIVNNSVNIELHGHDKRGIIS